MKRQDVPYYRLVDDLKSGRLSLNMVATAVGESVRQNPIRNGKVIKSFPSMSEAERQTGIFKQNISFAADNANRISGGCKWVKA